MARIRNVGELCSVRIVDKKRVFTGRERESTFHDLEVIIDLDPSMTAFAGDKVHSESAIYNKNGNFDPQSQQDDETKLQLPLALRSAIASLPSGYNADWVQYMLDVNKVGADFVPIELGREGEGEPPLLNNIPSPRFLVIVLENAETGEILNRDRFLHAVARKLAKLVREASPVNQ